MKVNGMKQHQKKLIELVFGNKSINPGFLHTGIRGSSI
jgi:hypothetical protein